MARGTTVHLCGTPPEHCGGSLTVLSAGFKNKGIKTHHSPQEAMRCHGRYLVGVLGYEKLSSREFRDPKGSGIRVLTKPCRFGASMRAGKEGNRNMPDGRRTGGVITSC
jgi:hypothetical protein